jgi:hypothetical protein
MTLISQVIRVLMKKKSRNRDNYLKKKQKRKQILPSRAWWGMAIIPALGRLRQEYQKFKTSLGA